MSKARVVPFQKPATTIVDDRVTDQLDRIGRGLILLTVVEPAAIATVDDLIRELVDVHTIHCRKPARIVTRTGRSLLEIHQMAIACLRATVHSARLTVGAAAPVESQAVNDGGTAGKIWRSTLQLGFRMAKREHNN